MKTGLYNDLKYNEALIQGILGKHITKKLKLPHFFCNLYALYDNSFELDFLFFDKSGYLNEYEIKTARQDALQDEFKKVEKHKRLSEGDISCPNKYWVVCPPNIVERSDQLPDYCGLIHLVRDKYGYHRIKIIKRAPFLHKDKSYNPTDFFSKIYYQLQKFQDKFFNQKIKDFSTRLKKADLIEDKPKKTRRKKRPKLNTGRMSLKAAIRKRKKKDS